MAGNSIFCTAKNPVTLGITKEVITPKTINMTIIPKVGPISALNVFLLISRLHLISFIILANASTRLPVFSPIEIKSQFEHHKPDLIFSTHLVARHEYGYLMEAKKRDIPTIGMVKSFRAYVFALRSGTVQKAPAGWKIEDENENLPFLSELVGRSASILDAF